MIAVVSLTCIILCINSSKNDEEQDDTHQRATKAILNAVTTVEDHAQRLITAEVESYFHSNSHPSEQHKKKQVAAHAQKAVQEGTRKVKESVTAGGGYTMSNVYPFEKDETKGTPVKHKDHRILDAVEAAEKAVLQAIQAEVDTMFHTEDDHHHDAESKTTVQAGLQKASKGVQDVHQDRRTWLEKFAEKQLEDYDSVAYFTALSNSGAVL